MTLSSLSFVVFVDPYQGSCGICPLSSLKIYGIFGIRHSKMPSLPHPISKAYVEIIGGDTTHKYLQIYIVKSNYGFKEISHAIKSRCVCVWNI